jgi:P4 family phage/plasmid primase-like protien
MSAPGSTFPNLTDADIASLRSSGLTDATITAMGCYSISAEEIREATGLSDGTVSSPGYAIPYAGVLGQDGTPYARYRLQQAKPKYIAALGSTPQVYVPPAFDSLPITDLLIVTEGERKAALGCQLGLHVVGIGGVFSWADPGSRAAEKLAGTTIGRDTAPLAKLVELSSRYSKILILGDSDLIDKPQPLSGLNALKHALDAAVIDYLCEQRKTTKIDYTNYIREPIISVALCPPRFDKPEVGKIGLDDWYLWLLERCHATNDSDGAARVKANAQLTNFLSALQLAASGSSDMALAIAVAGSNRKSLAKRDGAAWMTYDSTSGIWHQASNNEEYLAPPKIKGDYEQAVSHLWQLKTIVMEPFTSSGDERPALAELWEGKVTAAIKSLISVGESLQSTKSQSYILKQTEPRLTIPREEWNKHDYHLVCANGVIDLKTSKLLPHAPHYLTDMRSKVKYVALAPCPKWEAFLAEVQPDPEARAYLQRLAGYCAIGTTEQEQFFTFTGSGGNGKSVWGDAMQGVLGDYAIIGDKSVITASKNEPHPTGLARMADRRLVSFSETNEHVKLDCKVVKQITGGAALTARLMRQDFSEFQPKFTAILDTNDIPTIDDQTAAMHRRLVVIPWPFTPTKPNEKLKEELLAEAEGILCWVVEGAMLYLRDGLTAPASILTATAKLWESIDTVQMWMTNRAIVDPDPTIKTEARILFADYQQFCREQFLGDPHTSHKFNKMLASKLPEGVKGTSNGITSFKGIRLKEEAEIFETEDADAPMTLTRPPQPSAENRPNKSSKIRLVQ